MACLVLKQIDRSERRIPPSPDGQYRYASIPGERIIGIDPDCGGDVVIQPISNESAQLIAELDKKLGKGGGDWIKVFAAPVARIIGKPNCMSCEVRRVVVNAYANLKGKYGRLRALVMMWRLWSLSMKDTDAAVKKLKEYLNLDA